MIERVLVFRFKFYDITTDDWRWSRRWATYEAIGATKTGVPDRDSGVAIDVKYLDDNGMTERDFDPHSVLVQDGGFQKRVR
jgi:hypothetical protein